MNSLYLQGLVADLGHAFLHSLWQVAMVSVLLWSLLTLLHRASPRLRHVLAYGALVAALAWPAHTFQVRRAEGRQRVEARAIVPLPLGPVAPLPAPSPARLPGVLPWLGTAWIFGVLWLGARQAGGWLWLARVKARTEAAPEALQALSRNLARRMGIRAPELRVLAEAASPFCYGLLRTVVVLPAPCLAALDLSALEALLAHEFAHLRRWDFLFNGIQSFIDLLLFHHPLARWISSQARLERERACDEAAAAAFGDARTIARALLQLEDLRPPLAAPAAQGAPLTQRLPHLLQKAKAPSSLATLTAALLLGSATLLALPRFQDPARRIEAPAELVTLADAAARAEGLDPYLVRAVIQVESRFNPSARSSAGSVGLMQVLPATAAKLGVAHPEKLDDNLKVGAKYLRLLLDRYQGDTAKAVMAYNAGPESLDRAEGIAPSEETRTYALAVMDLYRRKAVEPAPVGTLFGTLAQLDKDTLDLRLVGVINGAAEFTGSQDTDQGTVNVFNIHMSTPNPGQESTAPIAPRIHFRLKAVDRPLRIQAAYAGRPGHSEIQLPASPMPSTFNLRMP